MAKVDNGCLNFTTVFLVLTLEERTQEFLQSLSFVRYIELQSERKNHVFDIDYQRSLISFGPIPHKLDQSFEL